jgi:hypothetical protein
VRVFGLDGELRIACIHAILSGDGRREPQERDQWSQQQGGEEWVGFINGRSESVGFDAVPFVSISVH